MIAEISKIAKEDIKFLNFKNVTSTHSSIERRRLVSDLEKAMLLGNGENHVKVKIAFESNQGLKMVETTVWAVDNEEVTLKSGILIPVQAIQSVEIL